MNFGDGVGPPLFEALIANSMLACVMLMCFYIGTAQRKKVQGWVQNWTFKEAPDSTCWGSIFGPPCRGNVFKKGVRKWTRLKSKVVPLEGPVLVPFWPLHCGKSVEAFISSWNWFDQQQLRLESWTGEAHFCASAFSYVLRSKNGSLLCHIVLLQFP